MNPIRTFLPALALAGLLFAPAARGAKPDARSAEPAPLATAQQLVKHATYDSLGALMRARASVAALSAADPRSAPLHYWLALADYRIVPRLMNTDKKGAGRYCTDGLHQLDQAIRLDPKFADAIALEAGLQGLAIALDPSRAMALGGEIEEGFGRAAAIAPKNPRVVLLSGINTLNKPRFVGGGADKAMAMFHKALELFAAEKAAGNAPIDWGYDEAYAWSGRAALELEKRDEARVFYHKALEINPGNAWVEHSLLPELDKAGKEGS
jgi:tetratricopeptide (TPR) repeat protein